MHSSDNYISDTGRRFIQYNMWKNCNNNCDFCFNRGFKKSCVDEQIEILNFTLAKLTSPEVDDYNEVGFIGGEFFDDQLDDIVVKQKFYQLFEECKKKIDNKKLNKVCVATSLVFDINRHLVPFIRFIDELGISNKVLFCTSYDTKYRFHTQQKLDLWSNNMLKMKSLVKNPVHTEIIVTQFFIDDVMNQRLDLLEFSKKYSTWIDFIEPTFIDYFESRKASIEALPDFFPKRSSFLAFVREYCLEKKIINIESFLSIRLRSDTSYYKLASGKWTKIDARWENGIRRIDKDGNAKEIFSYCDSDKKMTDDVLLLSR